MSSEANARKSRLAVPTGGADSTTGTTTMTTTTTTTSSSSGAATPMIGSSFASKHHHHHAAAMRGGGSMDSSSQPILTYLHRLVDVRQMDIQSALDQMRSLMSTRPQVVYKTSYYRKQTKNHWHRDDPAFVALQGVFLFIATIAYSVAFRISLSGALSFVLYTFLWNWLGMGLILSTLCREIANRHLNSHSLTGSGSSISAPAATVGAQPSVNSCHVRQQVEWLYAFDIHSNSFFPVFVLLYAIQFFLLPIVLGEGLLSLIVANSLYALALGWYWYITHLGYRSLPFLSNTEVFLFPIAAIALLYFTMLIGYPFGFGWNASRVMARFYFM